jgi:hypothetical protein
MVDILAVEDDEGRLLVSDMPHGAVKQALMWGFPNGATRQLETAVHGMMSKVVMAELTWGTETSKYPEEK